MKYYVFYEDQFSGDWISGLHECDSTGEVEEFIAGRLANSETPDIKCYRVVRGTEYAVNVMEVAIQVAAIVLHNKARAKHVKLLAH